MLAGTKPWYASKTVIGSVVALAGGVLSWLKYDADAELLADVGDQLFQLVTIVGALVALWGRLRATKKIAPPGPDSPLPPPPPQRSRGLGLLLGWLLLAAAVALTAGGCAPERAYVEADRATYQAIAPEYGVYVAADANLTAEQRQRRLRTIETWRLRIEAGERGFTTEGTEGTEKKGD